MWRCWFTVYLLIAWGLGLACRGPLLSDPLPRCNLVVDNGRGHEGIIFSCNGPANITVGGSAVLESVIQRSGDNLRWDGDCGRGKDFLWSPSLLVICSSSVRLRNIKIANIDDNVYRTILAAVDSHLVVENGSFTNIQGARALLLHNSTLQIEGSVFSSCSAPQNTATASLVALGSSVHITGCHFLGNKGVHGGGILALGSNVSMKATTFEENTAAIGGGISFYGGSTAVNLTIMSCTFRHNSAEVNGGAVSLGGAGVHVTILNSTFSNNTAQHLGGALSSERSEVPFPDISGHLPSSNPLQIGAAVNGSARLAGCTWVNNSASKGAALCLLGWRTFVEDCVFASNTAVDDGGAVVAMQGQVLTLVRSQVIRNRASDGGGLHFGQGSRAELLGCLLQNNSADSAGGGLYTEGISTTITRTQIQGNWAGIRGGGLVHEDPCAFHPDGLPCSELVLSEGVILRENQAAVVGGGICASVSRGITFGGLFLGGKLEGNLAPRGRNVYIPPDRVLVVGSAPSPPVIASRSSPMEGLFSLEVTAQVQGHPLAEVRLIAQLIGGPGLEGGKLASTVQETRSNGTVIFNNLKMRGLPGTYIVEVRPVDYPTAPSAEVRITIRDCEPGEVRTTPGVCDPCPEGSFSFSPHDTLCRPCPHSDNREVAQCLGGVTVVPLPGYWHSSPWSSQMHKCLNAKACVGHQSSGSPRDLHGGHSQEPHLCAVGYRGPLCGSCDSNGGPGSGVRYGSLNPLQCRRCLSPGAVLAFQVLVFVASLAFIAFTVVSVRQDNLASCSLEDAKASDYLKQFVLYCQHTLVISQVLVAWPQTFVVFKALLAAVITSGGTEYLSVDCVLPAPTSVPMGMQKLLISISLPVVSVGVLLAAWWMVARVWPDKARAVVCRYSTMEGPPREYAEPETGDHLGSPNSLDHDTAWKDLGPEHVVLMGSGWPLAVASGPIGRSEMHNVYPKLDTGGRGSDPDVDDDGVPLVNTHLSHAAPPSPRPPPGDDQQAANRMASATSSCVLVPPGDVMANVHIGAVGPSTPGVQGPPCDVFHDLAPIVVIVVVTFHYSTLVRWSLAPLACVQLDQPLPETNGSETAKAVGSFWLYDMDVRCWEGWHARWGPAVFASCTLTFCLALPLGVVVFMIYNRHRLCHCPFRRRYAFLYRLYRPEMCFYEGVMSLQTMGLVTVTVFGQQLGPYPQVVMLMVVLVTHMVLVLVLRPFRYALVLLVVVLHLAGHHLHDLGSVQGGPVQTIREYHVGDRSGAGGGERGVHLVYPPGLSQEVLGGAAGPGQQCSEDLAARGQQYLFQNMVTQAVLNVG